MDKPWTIEDRLAYLEGRIAVLERMVEVSQIITSTLDLRQVPRIIVEAARELTKTEAASILLLDKKTGELYFETATGVKGDEVKHFVVPLTGSISGWVLTHNEPLIIRNVQDDPRTYRLVDERVDFVTRSLMAAPLNFHGETIGVIMVLNRQVEEDFTDQDLQTLMAMAAQAAIAIENARLFDDLVRAYTALDKANRQLQEMDKLKSAFIGVITHELRSPFANIAFSLQLLERHGLEHLSPEQREPLEQIVRGVKSARAMVDNLVTFAAFLSKKGELRLTQLNFGEMVQDAVAPLKALAEANGIALHITVPDNLPSVYGDRERLSDAVYHLIHNAIKFTQAGGKVWIRGSATADAIRFEVQDTGVGVPADKLPTLWEGFTQMADPLRRGVEGLGLGLALVKYVVSAHDGEVWAQSEEGVGSTFGFQVPLSGPEHQAAQELAHMPGAFGQDRPLPL
jgi:signal transduction histidine kinase